MTEGKTPSITLMPPPAKRTLRLIFFDATIDAEKAYTYAKMALLSALESAKRLDEAVALFVLQGNYHERYLPEAINNGDTICLPQPHGQGKRINIIMQALKSFTRRAESEDDLPSVSVLYIGAAPHDPLDDEELVIYEQLIAKAFSLDWSFDVLPIDGSSDRECCEALRFPLQRRSHVPQTVPPPYRSLIPQKPEDKESVAS